jgi:AcrR family transcriptional regulator
VLARRRLVATRLDDGRRRHPSPIEEAAAAASISRTTAYRYFSNQRALLVAAHPETEARSLLPPDPPDDPAARLDAVIDAFTGLIVDTEPQQRTMLRLSLEPDATRHGDLLLRQGRAVGWIEEALAPLRTQMSKPELHRLVLAIRQCHRDRGAGLAHRRRGALSRRCGRNSALVSPRDAAIRTRRVRLARQLPDCTTGRMVRTSMP